MRAGFSIFCNITNTQRDAYTPLECLQIPSVPCHRINKVGTHAHHRDRSAAGAIFANGTYFLDNPRKNFYEKYLFLTKI